MPASAIGKPIAAEVPIAFCILTLHQVAKGTDSEPPPIATSADTADAEAGRAHAECPGLRVKA